MTLVMGLGAAMMGWLLSLGGYVGGTAEQTDSALSMIIFLYVWAPAIIACLQIAILSFYKLDKIYPQILSDLQARKEQRKK
ncbi:MFS transporter [Metabacillus malikii]|uniref:Na+/melibiose symporter-like transporter n=1 Tax=Metabacillus malikii TaxID=1504265 RepID=A0ABT9ZK63_9BACI|nr:MFS transporter [Metabacillus malikii]MDQ0232690.1 Na+/melibiose symporter-like transporter [Metabacillus malikii]